MSLFGSDAGGASILALMTNPDSKSLFHAAWLIDPALYYNKTFTDAARRKGQSVLTRTNCSDVHCLRKLHPRKVIEAYLGTDEPSFRIGDQNDLPIQGIFPEQLIIVDSKRTVCDSLLQVITFTFPIDELVTSTIPFPNGSAIDIPLLIGSASQAIEIYPGPHDLFTWDWKQYTKYVTTSLDSFGPRLSQLTLDLYPPLDDQCADNGTQLDHCHSPDYEYATMVTDIRQSCPIDLLAESMAKNFKSPIYRYFVTSTPSKPVREMKH